MHRKISSNPAAGGACFSHPLSGKDVVLDFSDFLAVNLETTLL